MGNGLFPIGILMITAHIVNIRPHQRAGCPLIEPNHALQEIRLKKKLPGTVNTAGATAVLTSTIVWGLQNSLSWKRILRYGYAAISITLQSRQPVNPQLCVSAVLEQEKLLFDT